MPIAACGPTYFEKRIKGVTRPAPRREQAEKTVATKGIRFALVCSAFGVSETWFRYNQKRDDESEMIADLLVLLVNFHNA